MHIISFCIGHFLFIVIILAEKFMGFIVVLLVFCERIGNVEKFLSLFLKKSNEDLLLKRMVRHGENEFKGI